MKTRQRGNTVIGLIIGIVLGLGVALGIAVYVTKVPIPFMNKTQKGGVEQDEAEARKNRDWNPNAPLAGKPAARPAAPEQPASVGPLNAPAPGTGPVPAVVAPDGRSAAAPAAPAVRPRPAPETNAPAASSDPLGDLARARAGITAPATATDAADPFVYFVQAGAFRSTDDAEAQRAKLSLMGVEARVTEREQAGRTVYRVRAGPFNKKDDADRLKARLDSGGLESNLVRVQR
ncbi:SPOR domain-containing protein [Variovorax sp. ZT4R33]|uniref:SPOR domain-containing protein n=1 Tax=Variovorax sp. ZT4R33 TaxID=3443743 RepID=UPI003F46ED44